MQLGLDVDNLFFLRERSIDNRHPLGLRAGEHRGDLVLRSPDAVKRSDGLWSQFGRYSFGTLLYFDLPRYCFLMRCTVRTTCTGMPSFPNNIILASPYRYV